METSDLFKRASALRKQGQAGEALALLRDALRRNSLGPEGIDRAGRWVKKAADEGAVEGRPTRVRLLGQCTTAWLADALTAVAWGQNAFVAAEERGYDNVLQELSAPPPPDGRPDVVVLLPWNQRLLGAGAGGSARERADGELAFWRESWRRVSEGFGSRLIQVGYDWEAPGAAGHHLGGGPDGAVRAVRDLNAAIREQLPAGAYFLDLEQVSGTLGRNTFYDARRYHWTKQPFSEAGTAALARHVWAGVRALTTGPKKVLVVDLDNTLWGGVVGEVGPLGITLGDGPDGEAFLAFQRHLKDLTRRGVVLAACSKNNPADAREPFEVNPEMVLRPADFAAFEACWDPKAEMIRRIARALDLGLDSMVFFDDHPAEREHVRQALPEIEVVDVTEDPAGYVRALQDGLWFEAAVLTETDKERAALYAVERHRRELKQEFGSMDDYLRSLEMAGEIRPIDEADLDRAVQLLAKTNQFNLTTRRHTREDVLRLIEPPGSVGLTLRVRDKFGDYGLVAFLIAVPGGPGEARIDTWLMSCRVIGRTVEHYLIRSVLDRCRALGYRRVVAEYVPTKKNALVSRLYDDLGFARLDGPPGDGDSVRYALDLDAVPPFVTFLAPADQEDCEVRFSRTDVRGPMPE